jgi:hypothetical protein
MLVAFALIVRQGGWQQSIQPSIAEGRWPLSRRLLLAGASLALIVAAGLAILAMIPGGIPWREPRSDISSFNEQPAPDFDPQLTLAWPGTPEESRRGIDPGTDRETTIYSARFTQNLPLTSFGATVYEFTEQDLQGGDPKEWLPRHLGGGNVVELSRRQVEHGPNKHLGFEVTAKDEILFIRRVNVLAGRRVYSVEVLSISQERLNAEDVEEFFESFTNLK